MTYVKRLRYEEFLPIAENLNYGQKIRVNHETDECSGDSNSLLVEKKHDGTITAYCFRCGRSGYYGSFSALKSKITGASESEPERSASGGYEIPGDSETSIAEWSSNRARLWVKQYGLTDKEVDDNGICYSPSLQRVILPTGIASSGHITGFQTRAIQPDDTGPKYLSYSDPNSITILGTSSDVIVITEDLLSAIKVSRHCQAMPLFSTKVRDIHVKYLISKGITTFIQWLDDDNLEVRRQTLKNQKLLNKIGTCYTLHTNGRDPKEHTDEEILDLLLGVLT